MVNLLPQTEKRRLHKEYLIRVLSAALVGGGLLLFSGAVFLLPAFFATSIQEEVASEQLRITEESIELRDGERVVRIIDTTNEKISVLSEPSSNMTALVEEVLARRSADISIDSIVYRDGTFTIAGKGAARDTLIRFQKDLEGIDRLSNVILPIESLASNENISFSITSEISGI